MEIAERLRVAGWRQGSVVPLDQLPRQRLSPEPIESDGRIALVASHDCDLLSPDLEKEPHAELICATPARGEIGNVRHGKSPRELGLDIDGVPHVLSIHDRCKIERGELAERAPTLQLDADACHIFRRWLAQRYQRTAFPDAFNTRIQPVQAKLHEKLKKRGEDLTAIFLIVTDDELKDDEIYDLDVIATVGIETTSDQEKMDASQALVNQIEKLFNDCEGVNVEASYLRSEAEVSLAELRYLKRWDVESVSFRSSPAGDIAPD